MYTRARLPGIHGETVPRPVAEALPRMDVAVFAGFAVRGPCHRAVAVDSVAAFEAVFGGDLPIALDPAEGTMLRANLASSVRAFFSNGGIRCWVVRLAMTHELAELWEAAEGEAIPARTRARAAGFAMPGLLARAPADEGARSHVRPAVLRAASSGAWADGLAPMVRVRREAIALTEMTTWRATGLSFTDTSGVRAGDMLEVVTRDSGTVRYAKVLKVERGRAWALWIACFRPLATDAAEEPGRVSLAGVPGESDAVLVPGAEPAIRIDEAALAAHLAPGLWLKFTRQGRATWLMVDRLDPLQPKVAYGRAWRQVRASMPGDTAMARRVTLEVATRAGGDMAVSVPLGLCREHGASLQAIVDDDLFYAPAQQREARARLPFAVTRDETARLAAAPLDPAVLAQIGIDPATGQPRRLTRADRVALRTGWLPLGLGAAFSAPARPVPRPGLPLERDGLAAFDHRVFLDPRLAGYETGSVAAAAEDLRSLQEQQLFGMHAALDIPGDLHSPASIVAVPDAVLPAWERVADDRVPPRPEPGAPDQPRWRGHMGGCAIPQAGDPLPGPDWSRFLDCATAVLAAPAFTGSDRRSADGTFHLAWTEAKPGCTYVLEEAARHDFADAAEVLRAADTLAYDAQGRGAGTWYYRLHVEHDGNVSAYAAHMVVVRAADYAIVPAPEAQASETLRRIQVALLRLCAGSADLFAVLSLPRSFRADAAARHARALAALAPGYGGALQLGMAEQRALSHGALYHPWIAARAGGGLAVFAPDGAVAGLYAARARARGAWIAPARDALRDVIGLDPAVPEGDLLGLDQSRVNAIRRLPEGFTLLDADTLSDEKDWRQVSTRRLVMLIRRAALSRGMPFVFEPNGPVARRAIERSFGQMLDELQRRGAFAGRSSADSFRLALPEAPADRDQGRLTVEIAVSPAQPLRFLTLRLAQQGSRLTFAEAA